MFTARTTSRTGSTAPPSAAPGPATTTVTVSTYSPGARSPGSIRHAIESRAPPSARVSSSHPARAPAAVHRASGHPVP